MDTPKAMAAVAGIVLWAGASGLPAECPERRAYVPPRVMMGSPMEPLAGPSAAAPTERAQAFVRQRSGDLGLTATDVEDIFVTGESLSAHTGIRHVFLRQRVGGVEVAGADANLSIAPDGSVLVFGHSFFPGVVAAIRPGDAAIDAVQAAEATARHLGLEPAARPEVLHTEPGPERRSILGSGGFASGTIAAKLVYQPVSSDEVRLAWQLEFEQQGAPHLWHLIVDARSGELLDRQDYTSTLD
jgi:extracellular elastinolytic metalloproteinase